MRTRSLNLKRGTNPKERKKKNNKTIELLQTTTRKQYKAYYCYNKWTKSDYTRDQYAIWKLRLENGI